MSRSRIFKKTLVEGCLVLAISDLRALGLLKENCSATLTWTLNAAGERSSAEIVTDVGSNPCIRLAYAVKGTGNDQTACDYVVQLARPQCAFGGARYWFLCPSCSRRVGKLYKATDQDRFACRHCNNLSYASRHEPRLARFGRWGFSMKMEERIERLRGRIRRWTYRGKPTRKVEKLRAMEERLSESERKQSERRREARWPRGGA